MVALFGLTYALVRSGRIHTGLAFANFAKELQRELDIIKLKLIPGFEIDWEARKETQVGVDKARYSLLIEAAGASIISLICLFKVLSALSLNG